MKNITCDELVVKLNDGKKIIVDFYADWCQPCKVLSPIMERVELEHNLVEFVKIDVSDKHPMLTELNVRAIPTVIMFDGKNEVARMGGVSSEHKLNMTILESYTKYE
jgi:thioredoxin 1